MMGLLLFLCCASNTGLDSKVTNLDNPQMKTILAQKAREEFKALKNKEYKPDLKNHMLVPVWCV